jgi:endonuclease YncB( thermonuclease family)
MGIILAILSVIGSVLGAIASFVAQVFSWAVKTFPWYVWVILIGVCIAFSYGIKLGANWSGSGTNFGCSCRDFMCRRQRDPRPPHVTTESVVSVTNGVTLSCKAGLRGRRTHTVTLIDVAAPESGSVLAEQSRANLEKIAGKTIRVETNRTGIFRSEAQPSLPQQEEESTMTVEASEEVEALGPVTGVVYGETGSCLQVEQLYAGMVKCLPSASKEWKRVEATAKRQKLGVWK